MRNRLIKIATGAAWGAGIGVIAYPLLFRHRCLAWGATADEVSRKLPGDELLPEADISRNRIATPGAALPVRVFNMLVMEPGSLVMERKMLLGIKQRAEDLARHGCGDQGPVSS